MVMNDRNRPLYMISVAAELAGVHPQTLRAYEQKGLVTPQRTSGNTRMYSQADIERLDLIGRLTDEGLNLAGVVRILDMKTQMDERDAEIEQLRAEIKELREQVHEYRMRETITALMPYAEGGKSPLALLAGVSDLEKKDMGTEKDG